MSLRNTTAIATYGFEEDAMGLGDFLTMELAKLPDDEIVVCVTDHEGRNAAKATLEREVLTDGSTVVNLVIRFDD